MPDDAGPTVPTEPTEPLEPTEPTEPTEESDDSEPRRRASTGRTVGVLVVTVAVVVGGLGWVRDATSALGGRADGPSYAHLVERATVLPEPVTTALEAPTPGFEEAPGALRSPPPVPEPSTAFQYQLTQQDADGAEGAVVPVRWSPCRPVHVVIATADAPEGFEDAVVEALGAVSVASGLVFTVDGRSTEVPDPARPPFLPGRYGDRWAPVVVGFADRTSVPALGGDALGVTSVHTAVAPDDGTSFFVSASVYLDTQLLGMTAIGGEPAYVPVMRHELGHVVGLGHVADPDQLMHARVGDVGTFQDGDLAGLAGLGAGPCAPDV